MRPSKLDAQSLEKWLGSHAGWETAQAGGQEAIARTFKLADFSVGARVRRARRAASPRNATTTRTSSSAGARARVVWTTHDQKGVTSLDTELAEATDAIFG